LKDTLEDKVFSRRKSLFSDTFYRRIEHIAKHWYTFSRNPLSIFGLVIVCVVTLVAILAPYVAPYPSHADVYVNLAEATQRPNLSHLLGTDVLGRDILSRIIYGFRFSLVLGVTVLSLSIPVGVILGLIAGYYSGRKIDTVIMRVTDVFLAVPPLTLALVISSVLKPNLFNSMMAVSTMWWTWQCRIVYAIVLSVKSTSYILSAEVIGVKPFRIMFREILPNCMSAIITKMTLDMGLVIIVGASLSFVGLGVQPPKPGLGTMVAEGAGYLPEQWWMTLFPALAIAMIVLGFNLIGDGLRDMFGCEEV